MIWISKLPIPPSANEMHKVGSNKVWRRRKDGSKYLSTSAHVYNSPELVQFYLQCKNFSNINYIQMAKIRTQCTEWIAKGFLLKIEVYVAFENSRIWTKEGQPQQIDADNRLKPMQDGLSKMLGIDDKWFFCGSIEKVTCNSKELESCTIKISPIKAKTLTEIQNLRNTAAF